MRFIEIQDGVSIAVSSIVSIQQRDELYSRVLTNDGRAFDSTFPYKTLLELVEINKENEITDENPQLTEIIDSLDTLRRGSQFTAV